MAARRQARTGDERRHPLPIAGLNPNLIAHMDEYVMIAHGNECELAKVRMCWEVF